MYRWGRDNRGGNTYVINGRWAALVLGNEIFSLAINVLMTEKNVESSPSLSSKGKGNGRKGKSSKPRPTAVATMIYKKLYISCFTHTDVTFVRNIVLLG